MNHGIGLAPRWHCFAQWQESWEDEEGEEGEDPEDEAGNALEIGQNPKK